MRPRQQQIEDAFRVKELEAALAEAEAQLALERGTRGLEEEVLLDLKAKLAAAEKDRDDWKAAAGNYESKFHEQWGRIASLEAEVARLKAMLADRVMNWKPARPDAAWPASICASCKRKRRRSK